MPERPDLEYVVPILARELTGQTITSVLIKKPVVIRVAMRGDFSELVTARTFAGVERRAHFVRFTFEGDPPLEMPVAPMLAGRFSIDPPKTRKPGDLAVSFGLSDGRELRYRDDVQMGKVFIIAEGDWRNVPGYATIGIDVLDDKVFTLQAFEAIAKKRRDQAKVFLMDKSALDAMGNAYADEVLFEAGVHPKAMMRSLPPEKIADLHRAIVTVLREARDEIQRRKPKTYEKIRDFLKVRGRAGESCVRCGGTLRRAGVHGHDAIFCPTCQSPNHGPRAGRGEIVDWSKVTRSAPPPKSATSKSATSKSATFGAKPAKPGKSTTSRGQPELPDGSAHSASGPRTKRRGGRKPPGA